VAAAAIASPRTDPAASRTRVRAAGQHSSGRAATTGGSYATRTTCSPRPAAPARTPGLPHLAPTTAGGGGCSPADYPAVPAAGAAARLAHRARTVIRAPGRQRPGDIGGPPGLGAVLQNLRSPGHPIQEYRISVGRGPGHSPACRHLLAVIPGPDRIFLAPQLGQLPLEPDDPHPLPARHVFSGGDHCAPPARGSRAAARKFRRLLRALRRHLRGALGLPASRHRRVHQGRDLRLTHVASLPVPGGRGSGPAARL
jgi:hypothetical protein